MKKFFYIISCFILVFISVFLTLNFNTRNYSVKINKNNVMLETSLLNSVILKKDYSTLEEDDNNLQSSVNKDVEVFKEVEKDKEPSNNSEIKEKEKEQLVSDNVTVTSSEINKVYVGLKFQGNMTAYGKDCCSSNEEKQGLTSSGYNLKKQGIYYNDSVYGKVRIVASDKNFSLYSIIRINDSLDGSYNAIVLDRGGSGIGLNKSNQFDLAVESEEFAINNYGVHKNIIFEVLRIGK